MAYCTDERVHTGRRGPLQYSCTTREYYLGPFRCHESFVFAHRAGFDWARYIDDTFYDCCAHMRNRFNTRR